MGEYYISLPVKKMSKPNTSFSTGCSNGVSAVVITFSPDSEFPERLTKIASQVARVIVVDNGTTGASLTHLESALDDLKDNSLIRNRQNLGVAAALNQGIRRALEDDANCKWVVAFDQDSLPADGMIKQMLSVWKSHVDHERLMIAGPRKVFVDSTVQTTPTSNQSWLEVDFVITSGSLFSPRAFEVAGYFNEGLFVDYVDVEFCLRLGSRGYQIVEVPSAEILHQIGKLEENVLMGRSVHPTHHPPLRRYYQFRNAMLLHRQYRKSRRSWYRKNQLLLLKSLILILRYERHRLQSLIQIMKGVFHGLAGRAGRQGEIAYTPLMCKNDG